MDRISLRFILPSYRTVREANKKARPFVAGLGNDGARGQFGQQGGLYHVVN